MSAITAGAELRRFELRRCVGAGGFGEVYQARLLTGSGVTRDVAVKLLLAAMDPSAVARLRDEAALLAALNHRAILAVDDLVEISGRPALVTEFVDGADLSSLVGAGVSPLPQKVALEIVAEVAGALDAALTTPSPRTGRPLGLIHRDIKPGNIRVGRTGVVKLLDFGIAVSNELPREAKTGTGLVVGTMGYLSPERLEETTVHPPSDIYALACVLCEALGGGALFHGLAHANILRLLLDDESHDAHVRTHLARLEGRVEPKVMELLRAALAFAPETRPDARAFERACEDAAAGIAGTNLRQWARDYAWKDAETPKGSLEGQTLSGKTMTGLDVARGEPSTVVPSPALPAARRSPLLLGGGAAALAVAVLAAVLATRGGPPSPPATATEPAQAAVPQTPPAPEPAKTAPANLAPPPEAAASAAAVGAAPAAPAADAPAERKRVATKDPAARASTSTAPAKTFPESASAAPQAEEVEVSLSSFPLGAEVKIFGRAVCKTPCKTRLPFGTHLAEFTLADGRTGQEVIAVSGSSSSFGHRF